MSRLKKSAAVGALAVAVVGAFEGIRLNAYPDPATKGPPWTVCYGETKGVKPGDKHTLDECKAMLRASLEGYAIGIERCITAPLTDERYVALVSFAYNVGVGAGVTPVGILYVTSNPGTGTFTVLMRRADGQACIIGGGKGWASVPPTIPGTNM